MKRSQRLRVLLIEDNPADADLIVGSLEGEEEPRVGVEHVEDLVAGLERLETESFDAALLDLSLPGSRGMETFEAFFSSAPGVPTIVLTGLDDAELAAETVRRGAQDYLVKGRVDGALLSRAVRYAVERQRLAADLAQQAAEARSAEARLRLLIEQNVDGIVIVDRAGTFRFVNPAAEVLFGRRQKDLLGTAFGLPATLTGISELEIPDDAGGVTITEMRVVETSWDGEPAYLASLRDISERRRLEEQLRQAQKMEAIGQLAGGIAHDFNNLLTVIIARIEQLLNAMQPQDPLLHAAQAIRRAGQRAASLTRQLLAFSRKQMLVPEVLSLNAIVAETESMLRPIIGEHIELMTKLAPELSSVEADPAQLQQVIVNLAANARDAMPGGGSLIIETAEVELDQEYAATHEPVLPGNYVRLAVSDTGGGMDARTQSRIFEPFYTTKGAGKGTGLGLATVYGIVKQSNGYVWVYSEAGHGTTFKIYFPAIAATPEQAVDAVEPLGDESLPSGSETVLLVEDQAEVRFVTRSALEDFGYTVLDAATGDEALGMLEERGEAVDLVITDVVMPQMSGSELADRLEGLYPGTAVLFISGYTGDAMAQHGFRGPGANYLEKPFTRRALARKVRDLLDAKSR